MPTQHPVLLASAKAAGLTGVWRVRRPHLRRPRPPTRLPDSVRHSRHHALVQIYGPSAHPKRTAVNLAPSLDAESLPSSNFRLLCVRGIAQNTATHRRIPRPPSGEGVDLSRAARALSGESRARSSQPWFLSTSPTSPPSREAAASFSVPECTQLPAASLLSGGTM